MSDVEDPRRAADFPGCKILSEQRLQFKLVGRTEIRTQFSVLQGISIMQLFLEY